MSLHHPGPTMNTRKRLFSTVLLIGLAACGGGGGGDAPFAMGSQRDAQARELEPVVITAIRRPDHQIQQPDPSPIPTIEPEGGGGGNGTNGSGSAPREFTLLDGEDPLCDQITRLVKEALADLRSVGEKLISLVGDVKVVFVGESHDDVSARNHLKHMVSLFHDKGVDCLAFEWPVDHPTPDQLPGSHPVEPTWQTWIDAANRAKSLGMTVVNIDQPDSQSIGNGITADGMDARNRFMSRQLERLLAPGGQCKKVMVINGSGHLTDNAVGGCLKDLPSHAQEAGISSHSVILKSRENAYEAFSSSPLLFCPAFLEGGNKPFVIGPNDSDLFKPANARSSRSYEMSMQPTCMESGKSLVIY